MINFDLQKRKFESYFGTRKYKLSFWGINPQIDWYALIGYFLLGVVVVMAFGFSNYRSVVQKINAPADSINKEVLNFDFQKVEEKINKSYGGGRGDLFTRVYSLPPEEDLENSTSTEDVEENLTN